MNAAGTATLSHREAHGDVLIAGCLAHMEWQSAAVQIDGSNCAAEVDHRRQLQRAVSRASALDFKGDRTRGLPIAYGNDCGAHVQILHQKPAPLRRNMRSEGQSVAGWVGFNPGHAAKYGGDHHP